MARHRTGLRNRYRSGRSTYSIQHKAKIKDNYGQYVLGSCSRPDSIAGHTVYATTSKRGA